MTARKPAPGDVVLIRATVAPEQKWPDDTIMVTVRGRTDEVDVVIRLDTVAEVLGPEWMPPLYQDVVLDVNGGAWQYDSTPQVWRRNDMWRSTEDLFRDFGPLILIARGGEPVAP